MKRIFAILVSAMLLASCIEDSIEKASLKIRISFPEGTEQAVAESISLEDLNITISNKSLPFNYSCHPDENGEIEMELGCGKYDLLASVEYESGLSANTSASEFILTSEGIIQDDGTTGAPVLDLTLNIAKPASIIIRELYYHGSSTPEGANYTNDRYIELYNNGAVREYLDSLCVCTIYPHNSTSGNNPWAGRDTIPIAGMCWMIPGNGTQYPIEPGQSCVLAFCAVDHTNRATSRLDMSRADFGFYDPLLSKHEIAAGIPALTRIIAAQGTAWTLSIHSPAVAVFRPEHGVAAYLADPSLWERYEIGKTSGTKYWHIAKDWIVDGIECADTPQKSVKRLPTSVDASYIYMESAHYSGKVITRREKGMAGGVMKYKDTNNSAEDFITDVAPNPHFNR
ncbi:MAG: DUF4876 domain-containing protein [Bacteroidales bacterium]|nr:DUF4876 domain-containing protein [Candidatus Equibacterium intestinale]